MSYQNDETDAVQHLIKRRLGLVLLFSVIVFGVVRVYFHHADKSKTANQVEETYTVPEEEKSLSFIEPQPTQPNNTEVKVPVEQKEHVEMLPAQVGQGELLLEKQRALQERLSAPLMIANTNSVAQPAAPNANIRSDDPNTQFLAQAGSSGTDISMASSIGALKTIVAQGTFIHASLESAINSDLPGYVRASVSEPIYAEDGSAVLIPVGSRLIGEYKSGMLQGQSRIFVVWERLLTPAGISVILGSPGTDSLGVTGFGADHFNRHFWQQFGTASLLSLISAGAANSGSNAGDSASAYREAVAGSFSQSASQSLQQQGVIPPTLTVNQGRAINIFVAKDLNFSAVPTNDQFRARVF